MTQRKYQEFFNQTDGLDYFWDDTRWLSKQLFTFEHYSGNTGIAATTSPIWRWGVNSGQDIWLEDWHLSWYVQSGGTNLGASHYWIVNLNSRDAATTTYNIASRTINSHPTGVYNTSITHPVGELGVLVGVDTDWLEYGLSKTGTPGDINVVNKITYRLVGT